jgi:hypothetical protein
MICPQSNRCATPVRPAPGLLDLGGGVEEWSGDVRLDEGIVQLDDPLVQLDIRS